jgi:hypothetical protein
VYSSTVEEWRTGTQITKGYKSMITYNCNETGLVILLAPTCHDKEKGDPKVKRIPRNG